MFLKYQKIDNRSWAIYKTRNTGTGNGMRGMQGMRGMSTRIPGNLLEDSRKCSHFSIPVNAREDSEGMLLKIPGNVPKDSEECSRRFRGMLLKIPDNVPEDFFFFLLNR